MENAELPLVYTGHEEEDADESVMTTFYDSDIPGEVVSITNTAVMIKDDDGNVFPYTVRETMHGLSNSIISFSVVVKIGDRVKKGDILVTPTVNKNKGYALGMNSRAAYMYYKGLNYEDAVIVSESYAKKMASYKMIDIVIYVKDTDMISYLKPIGSSVKAGDILCNLKSKVKAKQQTQAAFDNFPLTQFMNINYYQNNTIVPNNNEQAYVVDCKIFKNPDKKMRVAATIAIIDEYIEKDGFRVINAELPARYANMTLSPMEPSPDHPYTIVFRLMDYRPLQAGDKLANRWGNKGMISKVLPDDQMPYDDETKTPVELIINPASILKRKNPPQLYECLIGKLIRKVYAKVREMVDKGESFASIQTYLEPIYGDKFSKMLKKDFIAELDEKKEQLFRIAVGSYFNKTHDQVVEWAKYVGVSEEDYITDPEYGPIENKILIGDTYMYRLYHTADYDSKVTSSIVDSAEPYMGKGIYRDKGQKIAEMESWALMSKDALSFRDSQRTDSVSSQYGFLNELLLAGYVIEDQKGLPLLSNYRTSLLNMNK